MFRRSTPRGFPKSVREAAASARSGVVPMDASPVRIQFFGKLFSRQLPTTDAFGVPHADVG